MIESSHEVLVDVVEAEGVNRAAFSPDLEVDGVVHVPILAGVLEAVPMIYVRNGVQGEFIIRV